MTDYFTLAGTALNKQPRQLFGIATRTLKSSILPRLPIDIDGRYEHQVPEEFTPRIKPIRKNTICLQKSTLNKRETYERDAETVLNGDLSFLNETVSFENGRSISLDAPRVMERSLHWKLKCWGFEHLKPIWLTVSDPSEISDNEIAIHRSWLNNWMEGHPIAVDSQYLRRYWMPHSVCLRILNWARYDSLFATRLDETFRKEIRTFIYKNAAFLSDNIEHGVGGNHLIENAVALVVAGVYANKPGWLRQGYRIFEQAGEEQFFEDGGHIERSPMYHLVVCQRFLTAIDLLESIGEDSKPLRKTAADGVHFIERLRPPDDQIPLLNDSVFGEALPLTSCLEYAKSIGIEADPHSKLEADRSLPKSGFFWLGTGDSRLLVTAHEIPVPHLPAHAHVHPGQVCLWIGGKRVLTDTGVFEYAAGTTRQHDRSIRSHNTVQVGTLDPVRLASSFWMWGEVDPEVEFNRGSSIRVDYDLNRVGFSTYTHERMVEQDSDGWQITDQVECKEDSVLSRFHVHPECSALFGSTDRYVTIEDSKGVPIAELEAIEGDRMTIGTAPYHPRYGEKQSRDVVSIHREGSGTLGVILRELD
ncbi:alginate lyase family protein [Halobacterium sp. BOL4-2]|uniref:alginate lyase family protein n=1 Tax=Halobacterium sp. BOL4-2 TaxID=2810537 RepID=UPI0019641965|nr:alginate lyase family protein [Halobacterium sp. BOL4-2]QRY24862.1 heparinase II/III family protein [Halobacterium sp. BOL4-2]